MTLPVRLRSVEVLTGHRDAVFDLAFAPTAPFLGSASRDGTVRLWNLPKLDLRQELALGAGVVTQLVISPDSNLLAMVAQEKVVLWRPGENRAGCRIGVGADCVQFTPSGDELLIGRKDARIDFVDPRTGALIRSLRVPRGSLLALRFSPDGKVLAAATNAGEVTLFETKGWQRQRVLDLKPTGAGVVYSWAFSPDGRVCAGGVELVRGGSIGDTDHPNRYEIVVWDRTAEETPDFQSSLVGHTGWIGSLAMQPNGTLLASGGFDERVRLWDWDTRLLLGEACEHDGAVYGVAFSPDGRTLASCSRDTTIRLWDPAELLSPTARFTADPDDPRLSTEALLVAARDAHTHGREWVVVVADRLVDRLVALRSTKRVEDAVADLCAAFGPGLDRLMVAVLQVLQVRLERAFREGEQDEGRFYDQLMRIATRGGHRAAQLANRLTDPAITETAQGSVASASLIRAIREIARDLAHADFGEAFKLDLSPMDIGEAYSALDEVVTAALHGSSELPNAMAALMVVQRVAERVGVPSVAGMAAWHVSGALERTGHLAEAERWCRAAAANVAAVEEPGARATLAPILASLTRLLTRQGKTGEAAEARANAIAIAEEEGMSTTVVRKELTDSMSVAPFQADALEAPSGPVPETSASRVPELTQTAAQLLRLADAVISGYVDLPDALLQASALDLTETDVSRAHFGLAEDIRSVVAGRREPAAVVRGAELLFRSAERNHWGLTAARVASDVATMTAVGGDNLAAIGWFEQAVQLADKSQMPEFTSALQGNLANAYRNVGRLRDAMRSYAEALAIAEDQGFDEMVVRHLANRAIVYGDLGDLGAEIADLWRALLLARRSKFEGEVARTAHLLAGAHRQRGDLEGAERFETEALDEARRLGDNFLLCSALCDMGLIRIDRGDSAAGFRFLEDAREMAGRIDMPSILVTCLIAEGEAASSRQETEAARSALRQAVDIARQSDTRARTLMTALRALAKFEADQRSDAAAMALLHEAATVGERLRREMQSPAEGRGLQRTMASIYDQMIGISLAAGDTDEALVLLDQSTATLLGRRLRASRYLREDDRLDVGLLVKALGSIGSGSVLAACRLVDGLLRIFVVGANDALVHIVETGLTNSDIGRLAEAFDREVRQAPRYGFPRETWTDIGRPILEGLKPFLRGRDTLFVVPTGRLHGLPLHALGEGDRRLVDICSVAYLPSVRAIWSLTEASPCRPRSPLVVGAHFTEEAELVARMIGAGLGLVGERVERAQVLAQLFECDLLHVSAHGFYDEQAPDRSGLILAWSERVSRYLQARAMPSWARTREDDALIAAGGPESEAILSSADLDGRQMVARLVSLSACESGLVAIDPADDPVGLVPSLLAAGVPSVLATLWRVESAATADFMVTFYSELAGGNWRVPKPKVLRSAMIDFRRHHPSPYFWAPFVLIGGVALDVTEVGQR